MATVTLRGYLCAIKAIKQRVKKKKNDTRKN